MLLQLDYGKLIESPDLIYIPCVAYRFEPLFPDLSHNVLDGEALENGTIQAHMLTDGARFFCGFGSASSDIAATSTHPTKTTNEQLQRIWGGQCPGPCVYSMTT